MPENPLGPPQRAAHAAWVRRGRTGAGRILLDGEDLSGSRFGGASLEAIRLRNCRMDRLAVDLSYFDDAELSGCRGRGGVLRGCRFDGAILRENDLQGFDLASSEWIRARVSRCNLDGSSIERGKIIDSVVFKTSFRGAFLRDLYARNSRFVDCDFSGAILDRGRGLNGAFEGAIFLRCDLQEADFSGRVVRDCVFDGCNLRGAKSAPAPGHFRVEEESGRCPYCGERSLKETTAVLHGNPHTPASDTEVELRYCCGFCGYTLVERA